MLDALDYADKLALRLKKKEDDSPTTKTIKKKEPPKIEEVNE
jgi:hypothetical protein